MRGILGKRSLAVSRRSTICSDRWASCSGHAKEKREVDLARKTAALDADIKLQELQEDMTKEEVAKQRRRGHWRLS